MTTRARARAEHFVVVHRKWWDPARTHMAGFANVRRINMTIGQAMATRARAGAEHFVMINCEWWDPAGTHMAGFANVRRINMTIG